MVQMARAIEFWAFGKTYCAIQAKDKRKISWFLL
jgi:hypothetical protein